MLEAAGSVLEECFGFGHQGSRRSRVEWETRPQPRSTPLLQFIAFDADYLEQLTRSYNEFFFHYSETPLLVINTSEIDFVNNDADLENLISVIRKMKKGTHHYLPLASKKP